ncbi:MAG: M55 family metallopeptidase [Armatimonadetes bacterium]|nr:M55 family metallopeptidase [Armatimonadota bacterium]
MKMYLMTDLEGVAGVFNWENRDDETHYNAARRLRIGRWLAEEVNAAVDGFIAGGADEVIVNDGHGSGATIDLDVADPRAMYIHGRERPRWLPYLDTCDATGIVGAHAKASTPGGNLYHTMSTAIRDWSFNGLSVGEMGFQALIAGYYDIPFVFASGDAWACREIEQLIPGCVTVPVKFGTSRRSAMTYAPQKARELIRAGAERAMEVVDKVEPLKLEPPIVFRDVREEPTFDEEKPEEGVRVIDAHTREIESDDFMDLVFRIYPSFDRNWKPLDWQPAD